MLLESHTRERERAAGCQASPAGGHRTARGDTCWAEPSAADGDAAHVSRPGRHAARWTGVQGRGVSLVWWWSTLPIPIGPVRRGGRARAPAAMSPDSTGPGPPSPTSRLAPPQHKQRQHQRLIVARRQDAGQTEPGRAPPSSSSIAARRSSYRPRNCSPRIYIYSLQNKTKNESRERLYK
jgi:hypothetical protein